MKNVKKLFIILAAAFPIVFAMEIIFSIFSDVENNAVVMNHTAFKDYPEQYLGDFFAEMNELDERGAEWNHYGCWNYFPHRGKLINVDSSGRRATINPCSREGADTFTIFTFGGSTMWGEAAQDSTTIPSFLSGLLNRHPGCRLNYVIENYGQPGFVTGQEVLLLERELRNNNIPDFVIFYDGMNDVHAAYSNSFYGLEPCLPANEMNRMEEFNLLHDNSRMLSFIAKNLRERSFLLNLFGKEAEEDGTGYPCDAGRVSHEAAGCYRANLKMLKALSGEFGFGFCAFLQPVLFLRKEKTEEEQMLAAAYDSTLADAFEQAYAGLKNDSTGCFFNLSNAFNNYEQPLFYDLCHTNDFGNRIVADSIFSMISGKLCRQRVIDDETSFTPAALRK